MKVDSMGQAAMCEMVEKIGRDSGTRHEGDGWSHLQGSKIHQHSFQRTQVCLNKTEATLHFRCSIFAEWKRDCRPDFSQRQNQEHAGLHKRLVEETHQYREMFE